MSESNCEFSRRFTVNVECCHNCPDRKPRCHSTCKKYKDAVEEKEKKKAWLEEKNKGTIGKKAFDKHILNKLENHPRKR